ncbi:MAG TPA: NAD(P)H-dependent oxidoreductase [Candidatus Saccharimonadales bacterium]|nr:NAD(P)H-dependent oxidoreductase [Candidatus Saccharimonadales bacterium]
MTKIAIIVGSTRPTRFGIQPAEWLYGLTKSRNDAEYELIDLKEVDLPLLNEPKSASTGEYKYDYTKKWSEKINGFDGFVFVTPEYNHSTSAALKNAIDYLWHEWNYKPVAYIGYGGGAGGARAIEHLRGIAAQVKMYDLFEHMLINNYYFNVDESGKYKFDDGMKKAADKMLDELVFWAERMKEARKLKSAEK